MSLTYGYDLKDGDKILEASALVVELLSPLLLPGGSLVNHLPFCAITPLYHCYTSVSQAFSVRHIPSWVPYFSYEPFAQIVRKLSQR